MLGSSSQVSEVVNVPPVQVIDSVVNKHVYLSYCKYLIYWEGEIHLQYDIFMKRLLKLF